MSIEERSLLKEKEVMMKTSLITITGNLLLSLVKLVFGIIGLSSALVADAIHSLSDVFSTLVVIIGGRVSRRAPDETHHYGHEKFESVASLVLGMVLVLTAIGIGYRGILSVVLHFRSEIIIAKPTWIALNGALISIVVKEIMYRYTIINAKKANSTSMVADAWHHRSDALSSFGSLVGISGAILGFVFLDPIASVLIAFIILRVAIKIFFKTMNQVVDRAPEKSDVESIKGFIRSQDGVIRIDNIKMRLHMERIFIDLEIAVDSKLSLSEACEIAERVHQQVETTYDKIKHCNVRVSPYSRR